MSKTIIRSRIAFPVVYTSVKLVRQLQVVFRLVLCIAHRCDCEKRNKVPVCTFCIRCKHTNDHIIPGFDCNQVQDRPWRKAYMQFVGSSVSCHLMFSGPGNIFRRMSIKNQLIIHDCPL